MNIDWLNEKNQGILAALDRINVYIDSTNTEFYEIRMPQSDQVLELEMADGEIQYAMQTSLNNFLSQEGVSPNYQILNSFAIENTKTPVPLIKTDNTISEELTLHDLVLSYTRADSARTIKPTVLPRQFPLITDIVYYVHDHLGNTRVTYSVESFCTKYNLEGVFDYYPYGKILREYQPNQTEKYLTTHHQRDEETTLDYRYARFYDSDLGRFLSIDPMAADYASWSGYNYVVGNPLTFIDINGEYPIEIITRSYAPFRAFGPFFARYHGDNRGHSLNKNASSRTSATINYDTETYKRKVVGGKSLSYKIGNSPESGTYSETYIDDRSEKNKIDVHSYGNNADQPGSWDIDQFTKLSIGIDGDIKSDHILNLAGTISGDDFPNQESLISDSEGNTLWLGNFRTSGGKVKGPTYDLARENEGDVHINVNISIKVNSKGVFQGVIQDNKTISINDWNKKFE